MNKHFAVFAGPHFYPAGGWGDLQGRFTSLKEAKAFGKTLDEDWWYVVDLRTAEKRGLKFQRRDIQMSDLQRLFDTDPLDLTKDDITTIVGAYRLQRAQFNLGIKAPSKAKKAAAEKIDQIDLDDLLSGT